MKRCPECRRDYYDDSLLYCLEDGVALVQGSVPSPDEPPTAILRSDELPSEAPTRAYSSATDRTDGPSATESPTGQKKSFNRVVLIAPIALALLLLAGFAGYRYLQPPASGSINSIAVLPFENRSSDADTDYLSDGLAESLIFRLTQLPDLKVSPTTSVMRYKGTQTDVSKIAAELGVDAVMTGRMTKRGESLNISVELVDARNNTALWGEQYERSVNELLATQREIAATIAKKLRLKLSGNERGVTKNYTDSNEAYQLFLKGRFLFARRTKSDVYKSIEIFEEAVKLDPEFALGYVGIAESWAVIPSYPYASSHECFPKAKQAINKALEIDPELPEAHVVSAMIAATYDWDWAKAEAGFKRGLELGPNVALAHYRYGWTYLSPIGRHDEAIAEMRVAMEKEPLNLIQGANYAAVLMYARRFDEAVEQAKRTRELDPNFIPAINFLGHAYTLAGMHREALQTIEGSFDSEVPIRLTGAYNYARLGERERALSEIEIWKRATKGQEVENYWLAVAYLGLGDKDAALAELEKAYQDRDWFLQRIKVDPYMDPLRDDPRFADLMRRMNFPD